MMCRRKLTLPSAGNDRIQLPVIEGFPAADRIGTLQIRPGIMNRYQEKSIVDKKTLWVQTAVLLNTNIGGS